MSISKYLSLITSEHADKPKFMAWLTAALQMVDDGMQAAQSIPGVFDINNAVGVQLDVLGQIIGQPRDIGVPLTNTSSILDDEHYRLVLQARIARNNWDGTIPSIYTIWDAAFPAAPLQLVDNQDMTMQAVITNLTDDESVELVTAGLIVPKPMGVGLSIVANTVISESAYLALVVSGGDIVHLTTTMP